MKKQVSQQEEKITLLNQSMIDKWNEVACGVQQKLGLASWQRRATVCVCVHGKVDSSELSPTAIP